jgi:intracellular sulfur oxidation DsrE/DsrF family protein
MASRLTADNVRPSSALRRGPCRATNTTRAAERDLEGLVAKRTLKERRAIIVGLGTVAAAGALGDARRRAQESSDSFTPLMHQQDAWMSALRGKHRIDGCDSSDGLPDAIRFTEICWLATSPGGVSKRRMWRSSCLRHGATPFGYTDAIWSKYGKTIDHERRHLRWRTPTTGERSALADLAKQGVQFMVCGTASRGLAGRIAGSSGDTEAVLKEMGANLIASARIVPAGVVAVVHAQERRFALVTVA